MSSPQRAIVILDFGGQLIARRKILPAHGDEG